MMVTITARLTTNAKMENGMWTAVTAMSLAYTDLAPMALRIQEGRHSVDCSWLEIVPFVNELFKLPLVPFKSVKAMLAFSY